MSTYYYGSGLSYLQYLQAKSFVSDIKGAQQKAAKAVNLSVARQTRELIASQEALARENIRAMESGFGRVAQATEEGFEQLTWEIQSVSRGVSELNASFQWGFSEMLNQMTRMNSAMSELVKLAKTPVQTEANEYFQNARDALRRGLYPEALEEADKAISKHKLEWRYYSLAGTIRLGSISGGLELLDLAKAEEYFRLAARYAATDYPADAARSLLAAGWAAYCQNKMGAALTYTEEAASTDPGLAEAFFQVGKIHMALGEPENGLDALEKAIHRDKGYALKAAGDGDYKRFEGDLREFLEAMRQEKLAQIRPAIERALAQCQLWLSFSPEAKADPLVSSAERVIAGRIPLWDLLNQWSDFQQLPQQLSERARAFQLIARKPGAEQEYETDESFTESTRFGPIERTRRVKRRAAGEVVEFRTGIGSCDLLNLRLVPPGRFIMHVTIQSHEYPIKARITRPYILSSTPVTQEQYRSVIGGGKSGEGPSIPVVNVSWLDAVAFCNALSRALGLDDAYIISKDRITWRGFDCNGYRLPTHAEWLYACTGGRARVGRGYWDNLSDLAWSKENSAGVLHAVGQKRPNEWGMHDMLGNAAEWVFDWWVPVGWEAPENDPSGPPDSARASQRITIGGSYADSEESMLSGGPLRPLNPTETKPTVGFRIARSLGT